MTHTHVRRRALALLAAALLCAASAAHAGSRAIAAQVVWARPGWCYLASDDSTLFTPGLSVSIARGEQQLASGRVERVLESRLAAVRLSSGALDPAGPLDELTVSAPLVRDVRLTRLRVGLPAAVRRHPCFACERMSARTEFATEHYDAQGDRLVRRWSGPTIPIAPDTLDITWFADAADADIAIARGELDVAVFWPGELPARLRAPERAADVFEARRSHGVLAAAFAAGDTLPLPASDLAWLAREGFAGDAHPVPPAAASWTGEPAAARYRLDAALAPAAALSRALTRVNRASARRTVTLRWLDDALAEPAGDTPDATNRGVPVLVPVCRVVCADDARAIVQALGADAFADLAECARVPR